MIAYELGLREEDRQRWRRLREEREDRERRSRLLMALALGMLALFAAVCVLGAAP